MRQALFAVFVAGYSALLSTGAALAQGDQWNALYDRIIRIEHELKGMRGSAQSPAQQPAGDAAYRLTALEDQMRQLLGQMQDLSFRVRELQAQLQAMGGRKQGSYEAPAAPEQVAQAPQPDYTLERSEEPSEPAPYQTQELADLATSNTAGEGSLEAPAKADGPQVLGQLRLDETGSEQTAPRSVEGIEQSLLPETVETASLDGNQISGAGEQTLYEQAYDSLLGRRFGAAEAGFKTYLSRHGDGALAGDAQYWLGETYYVQGDYKQAAQSFLRGYKSYPKNRKAPDSLFKLAMSLHKLGQTPQACGTYGELTKQYPKATGLRNQALKEMQRAGC